MTVEAGENIFKQLKLYNYTRHSADKENITWLEAEYDCQQSGGHLLSLHSDKEMKEINEILPETFIMGIYIGLQVVVRIF